MEGGSKDEDDAERGVAVSFGRGELEKTGERWKRKKGNDGRGEGE